MFLLLLPLALPVLTPRLSCFFFLPSLRPSRIFVVGIGFFSLCFLMTSLGGQFSAKRLGDSPFTMRTEGSAGACGGVMAPVLCCTQEEHTKSVALA